MRKECAYCGKRAKHTREHIWPSGIIDRVPTYQLRYSEPADRVVPSDLVIADVCAECNNGPLAELDAYGCELHDRYFHRCSSHGDTVLFHYDYALLGRWLLKSSSIYSGPS